MCCLICVEQYIGVNPGELWSQGVVDGSGNIIISYFIQKVCCIAEKICWKVVKVINYIFELMTKKFVGIFGLENRKCFFLENLQNVRMKSEIF